MRALNKRQLYSPHTLHDPVSSLEAGLFCGVCGIFTTPSAVGLRPTHLPFKDPTTHSCLILFGNMKSKQHKNRLYNQKAFHLSFRSNVVEWLAGLKEKLGFTTATLHLSVAITDFVFAQFAVEGKQIKALAFMSLYIAAKLEEKDEKLPTLDSVVNLFRGEFNRNELAVCETTLFKITGYQLNLQTPYRFVEFLIFRGVVFDSDVTKEGDVKGLVEGMDFFLKALLEISLMSYDLNRFSSLLVACSIIALARKRLGLLILWPSPLEKLTGLEFKAFEEILFFLENFAKTNFERNLSFGVKERGNKKECVFEQKTRDGLTVSGSSGYDLEKRSVSIEKELRRKQNCIFETNRQREEEDLSFL